MKLNRNDSEKLDILNVPFLTIFFVRTMNHQQSINFSEIKQT